MVTKGWRKAVGVVCLLAASTALASENITVADSAAADCNERERCHCFRGRPQPKCYLFWLTELGVMSVVRSENTRLDSDNDTRLILNYGYMFNVGRNDAVGASVSVITGSDEEHSYPALIPRYRRWLSQNVALDIGVGLGRKYYGVNDITVPLVAQLGLSVRDYFSTTVLIERFKWSESVYDPKFPSETHHETRTGTTVSAGVTLGSYPALVATGMAIVLALVSIQSTVVE